MAILMITVLFIAIFHFVYDDIVLPSIRQHLRNKLYALRDELRWLKINGIDHADNAAFELVHDAINTFANRLPMLTISVRQSFEREIKHNTQLQHIIETRTKTIKSCRNSDIQRIYAEVNNILETVYIANAGGWFIYIVPLAILLGTIKHIAAICGEIALMPTHQMNKLIPPPDRSLTC